MKKLNMDNYNIRYELIEGSFTLDSKTYVGYGISVIDTRSGKCTLFHDISVNKNDIANLVSLCNELKLDPIHIRDVIDDFLVSH